MKRVIDKKTKMFIRDDIEFDEKTEIGLDASPSEGLWHPKWDGEKWVEGLTQTEIDSIKAKSEAEKEPTIIETLRAEIDSLKTKLTEIEQTPTVKTELSSVRESELNRSIKPIEEQQKEDT